MSDFLKNFVPIFFWGMIALEIVSVVINALALAVDLPPTKIEIGHGLRVLKVFGGAGMALLYWQLYTHGWTPR